MDEDRKKLAQLAAGATLTGVGVYAHIKAPEINRWAQNKVDAAYRAKMGGQPDEIGGSVEDKLERLHRRAKGTPEGDAALRKLTALRVRQGKTFTGRAKRMIGKITRLSARETLNQVIEFDRGWAADPVQGYADTAGNVHGILYRAKKKPGAAEHGKRAAGRYTGGILGGLAATAHAVSQGGRTAETLRIGGVGAAAGLAVGAIADNIRKRKGLSNASAERAPLDKYRIESALKKHIASRSTATSGQFSARARLIELKAMDLGTTYGECAGVYPGCDAPSKKHYPSLYISDKEQPIDLPLSGTAKVKFKTRSKTDRQDENGKTRHSADIEIQSIDVLEADEPASKKLKEGAPAKINNYAARARLGEIIELGEGEAVGSGIQSALRKIMQINKPLGAGKVVKRKFYPRQWDNIGQVQYAQAEKRLADKLKPGRLAAMSARLGDIIELAADPRSRNHLGMFDGGEEGAPNPNAIDQVYKAGAAKTIGQNLTGGAVAGVGAAASSSALKAIFSKIKKARGVKI